MELQAQVEIEFPERMFLYNVRAYDLYRRAVMSLAVLADTDPKWRPGRFGYETRASGTHIWYSVVKLLDYRDRQAELEANSNPFGLAVLAHLKTQETRGDAQNRLAWKLRLARMLFDRRWTREQIEELLQFLDWIMTLPEELEDNFEAGYKDIESEETMAETMPPLARRALARELARERAREAVSQTLTILMRLGRKRLGEPSGETETQIAAITDRERLEHLCERVYDVETWEELLSGS